MKKEFLRKAEQNLRAAELLFENGLYDASTNRSYYAALHAAVAALSGAGIKTERISHETTQAKFAAELIRRRKIYPSRLKSYLSDLQRVRDHADYKLKSVSKKVASRQLNKAKEFVANIIQEVGNA
ncbi:HEPN domain-containing protein [Desulfococcaceae bacterium HSG8]|nr:HEPN domain-containing protein [Desulfococcaceae bacterium HSG8]